MIRRPQQLRSAAYRPHDNAAAEFAGLVLGDLLGEGAYRSVYACPIAPELVIKVEDKTSGRFCNVDEWNLWHEVIEHEKIAAWFAPVRFISSCGCYLVQERTQKLARLPKQVPHFMADVKLDNMGRLRGRPVFHDYANIRIEKLVARLKLVDVS